MIELDTTRFGHICLPPEAVVHFPSALYGLDSRHAYCLLEHDDLSGFYWLQSVDDPALALIVTDPFRHFPEYEVEIPDEAAVALQAGAPTEVTVYTTVSVSPDGSNVSTNLLGPIVINHRTGQGMQIIQHGASYTCRHPLGMK